MHHHLKLGLGASVALGLVVGLSLVDRPMDADAPEPSALGPGSGTATHPDLPVAQPEPPFWHTTQSEKHNKKRRKEWRAQMHRSPPDVDWKEIEKANGLRQIDKRNAIARARATGATPPPDADLGGTWVERGSENQAGRMHVARHATDGATLYAGSSNGGVWKGTVDGTDWTPIGDNLYGGAHWLEVTPGDAAGDPDVVLAATDGGLVHYTTDDGATWEEPTGLGSSSWTRRLLKLEDGSETLFMLSWIGGSTMTLYRSEDGGRSWDDLTDTGSFYADLWAPRDGGTDLYLATASGIAVSEDLGETWTEQGGWPTATSQVELTGSEDGAPTLYAALGSTSLYRSDDAGVTWTFASSLSDYWSTLNASSVDRNVVAYGGVELYRSFDGGNRFAVHNNWWDYYDSPADTLHADMMGIDVVSTGEGTELWYINTDGGVYRSENLESFENLGMSGLRVSQYYDVHTSSVNPDNVIAGAQDQGYRITNGVAQDDDVYEFDQIYSGDYGHLTSGDGSQEYVFSVYPGFLLVQVGEEDPWLSWGDFPSGESYVPWLPPVVADPDDITAVFFPATKIYRYLPNWSTYLWEGSQYSEQDFQKSSGEYISKMVFSPVDSARAYVATSYGRFWYSDDHGVTWTESYNNVSDDNWYYGQAMVASRTNRDIVVVGGSGYAGASVVRSTDGGQTFEDFAEGIDNTLVYSLCEASDDSGVLFAGTETTVYRRDPDDSAWRDITGDEAPVTIYWDCESLADQDVIRFATYGRGIWDFAYEPYSAPDCVDGDDLDEDGSPCEDDCDDLNADVYPGAEDICGNGVDEDCDGEDAECSEGDSGNGDDGGGDTGPGTTDGGDGGGGDDGGDPLVQPNGLCGCSAATGAGPGALVLGLFGLLALRRRRPAA